MKTVQEKPATVQTKRLVGKIALVTGGSRGIGAGIAQRLAAEGATVAITYAKNKKAADEVVAAISQQGTKAVAFKSDVATAGDTENLIKEIEKSLGRIDILINNAGVFAGAPVDQIDLNHFNHIFDVNVKGVVATTAAAVKLIPKGGRIINISSVAAKTNLAGFSVYSASKAALDALTRVWAQDLGSRQITVNAVAPGTTASDMYDSAFPDDEAKNLFISKTALGRLGQPDDIAAVVAFLASEDGGWVTGQTITADGGLNV
jgi:3-oxoacyl-[acyl-carrier protein] reductase